MRHASWVGQESSVVKSGGVLGVGDGGRQAGKGVKERERTNEVRKRGKKSGNSGSEQED